jgi:tubulin-specific chaperone E
MLCRRTDVGLAELLFPSLSSLSVSGNNLSTFHSTTSRAVNPVIPTIKTLIMDTNAVSSLVQLCDSLIHLFPNLTTLSLQHNQISMFNSLASSSEERLPVYPSITTLNLSHNAITTPTLISSLPQIFPNLASLRVSHNPLFSSSPAAKNAHHHGTEDAAFMLTLARLPTLAMLNYSAITEKDRMDGELYYLSVAEKDVRNTFEARADGEELDRVLRDWGRYDELCRKYERENILEKLAAKSAKEASDSPATESAGPVKQKPKYPPKSLGARLVTFTFVFHPTSTSTSTDTNTNINNQKKAVSLTLPRTLDVYRVKGLLMRKIGREWGLRPLGFAFEVLKHHETAAGGSGAPEEEEEVEVEVIPDSTRRIGDWIPDWLRECIVRVKPGPDRRKEESELERMDIARLVAMAPS